MPSAGSAADIPNDVCCTTFYDIGERIRTVAFQGVCRCIDPDCVDREFASYQTEGEIVSILGESLVITFVRSRVILTGRDGRVRHNPVTRIEYRLELRENGWPLPVTAHQGTQTIVQADWEKVHLLSKHARGHGEKMWRSLVKAIATTQQADMLFRPSLHPHIIQGGVILGDMTPLPNTGPQVGYRLPVFVDTQLV